MIKGSFREDRSAIVLTVLALIVKSVFRERHQSNDILVAKSAISRSRIFFHTHAYDALRLGVFIRSEILFNISIANKVVSLGTR